MKICILKESLCIGGTERSAANISKILCEDHDVWVTVFDGSQTKYTYGGQLVDLNLPAKDGLLSKVLNNIKRVYKYRQMMKRERIDVLFEFISIKSPLSLMKSKNRVRIISSRDFWFLSTHTKRVNQCLKNADAMVCNSRYLRKYYLSKYPEHEDKVFSVYNMIDANEIRTQGLAEPESDFMKFRSSHTKTVAAVGRFCKEKGFEYLIQAFAEARKEVADLGLVLVGDGADYREKYQTAIERLNLQEHVYFTGFQKNPYPYMARCSCFVLSSLSEGFPNVLAEAMALGLPVIATNCLSGPAEILRKDGNYDAVTEQFQECDYGLMSPRLTDGNNDAAIVQLGNAISTLLSSEEMMRRYAALSRQRAQDFSPDTIRTQLNGILDALVERKKTK